MSKRRTTCGALALLLTMALALAGLLAMAGSASAQVTFVVTTTTDNATTPPSGSLRAAIIAANAVLPGPPVVISFDVEMVLLVDELPAITRDNGGAPNITIDGTYDYLGRATVYNGAAGSVTPANGLTINTDDCTIQDIQFQDFGANGVEIFGGSQNTLSNVRCNRTFGNGILVDDDDPDDTLGNVITNCQVQTCARSAAGPAGTITDSYGIKVAADSQDTLVSEISNTYIYDCGNIPGHAGGGIGLFNVTSTNIDGCGIGTSDVLAGSGNVADGLVLGSGCRYNNIGGDTRNYIMSNVGNGIRLNSASENYIYMNSIGINLIFAQRGNGGWGMLLEGGGTNYIGTETVAGVENYVCFNALGGIYMNGSNGNTVFSNAIGTDGTGTLDLGNFGNGIAIGAASDNIIGGDSSFPVDPSDYANTICYNDFNGVQVSGDAPANWIGVNTFDSNDFLGIDISPLADEPNDPATYVYQTPDSPNMYMPYPVIDYAAETSSSVCATGTSVADSVVTVYLCDVFEAGYGQGASLVGQTTADGDGNWSLDVGPQALSAGDYVTATATDNDSNTSEFSANYLVTDGIPPSISILVNSGDPTNTLEVPVDLEATDNYYPATDLQYQVSNAADFSGATWQDCPGNPGRSAGISRREATETGRSTIASRTRTATPRRPAMA